MRTNIVEAGNVSFGESVCLVIPAFSGGGPEFGGCIAPQDAETARAVCARELFSAKAQTLYYIPTPAGEYAGVLLLGLGARDEADAEVLRRAAGKACQTFREQRISSVVLDASVGGPLPVEAFVEGVALGQYDYVAHKEAPEEPVVLVEEIVIATGAGDDSDEVAQGCDRARRVCDNVNWARDLANAPPNELNPVSLARHAEEMAKAVGCECTIFDENELESQGMNAILAVGKGSAIPPRLIVLRYEHPAAEQTLAIVGKGVTFDTGGVSIKPGEGMQEMKWDMCGAAAVLGAMKSICELKPKVNVVCVVPTSENKTGADAYLPGDIITTYSGKTVEVHNTDAEGRMLLADALSYTAKTYTPDAIVDVATLTGACIVALGHYAAAAMTNDDDLLGELELAAEAAGERIWPLPMWKDYGKLVEGTHADLCNTGPRGEAGSITAACFLQAFVGDTRWTHLDIAGVAWGAKHIPYWDTNHASGFGVRLLTQWILNEAAES